MCLSLMRTGVGVMKYALFNVSNRFQTNSNSIDYTITTFDVLLCNFFSQCCMCKFFLCPFGALQFFFLQILPLPPPPPPPPPRDQLVCLLLLSVFNRLFVKLVYKHLIIKYSEKNNLLYDCQHGLRKTFQLTMSF